MSASRMKKKALDKMLNFLKCKTNARSHLIMLVKARVSFEHCCGVLGDVSYWSFSLSLFVICPLKGLSVNPGKEDWNRAYLLG